MILKKRKSNLYNLTVVNSSRLKKGFMFWHKFLKMFVVRGVLFY